MNKLGIMQGRLTNKNGFFPQDFPWENWKEEFNECHSIGIELIEWMFNAENYLQNPIFNNSQIDIIRNITKKKQVCIESICANYFMQNSLFDIDLTKRKENLSVMLRLLDISAELNITCIVLPLFGVGNPCNEEEETLLVQIIDTIFTKSSNTQTCIAIESDWNAEKIVSFIGKSKSNRLKLCFDVGNAVGMGYDIRDIILLKDSIFHIHIKDKKIAGTSVMLGEGDVNFEQCLSVLKKIHYSGNYILESYFASNAVKDTKKNYTYIKNNMDKLEEHI